MARNACRNLHGYLLRGLLQPGHELRVDLSDRPSSRRRSHREPVSMEDAVHAASLGMPWTPIRPTEALERPCPRVKRKPRAGLRGTGENEKAVCTL